MMKRATAYVSSASSQSEAEEVTNVVNKTKRKLIWEKFTAYSNDQEAKIAIASENTWSAYNTNNCSGDKKKCITVATR